MILVLSYGSAALAAPPGVLSPCAGCHALNGVKKKVAGPPLAGLYGAKPLKAGIKVARWDDASLNRFLWNPEKVDPTTRMFFKVRDDKRRAEIIIAMKALK
ncbi:MAG: hypothetical protein FJZ01_07725 [Candidatus Sericytochromatia bacterium]|nr:hypothetical protein [Candidatus Tanganyikabacteria bacterium]